MTVILRSLVAVMIGAGLVLSVPACATDARTTSSDSVDAQLERSTSAGVSLYDLPAEWRDHAGAARTLSSFAGRVQVLTMVYTRCTSTCPLILADLKRIEASIPESERTSLGFVLVSLDSDRDTPGRLAAWAADTRLDLSRWTLLSGSDEAVRELAATIDVRYQRQRDGEMAHTNAIVVLDTRGIIAHQQLGLGSTSESERAVARLISTRTFTPSPSALE
jgi:protein SCO1